MGMTSGLADALKLYFGVEAYPVTPFNAARQAVNVVRAGILGAGAAKSSVAMMPYLAYKSYKNSRTNESDAYQELILHAAVAGVDRFLMWNTHAVGDDNPVVSRALDELEAVIELRSSRSIRFAKNNIGKLSRKAFRK